MVRVAFFIDQLAPGAGTENQLLMLLAGLDAARVEPTLVTLTESPHWPLSQAPCPARALGVTRLRSPAGARAVLDAARDLRKTGVDLVVTFFPDASVVGVTAARLAGRPVITTRRNLGYDVSAGTPRRYRVLNPWTTRVVANAHAVAEAVGISENLDLERIDVIPNAVDLDRFRPRPPQARGETRRRLGLPADGPILACVANLRPVKGLGLLLTALGSLHGEAPHLALAGDGPLRASLQERARALGLQQGVTFLGKGHDVTEVLTAADAFVLASTSEGMPNAVLEAMAQGLPVIATAVGGTEELLGGAGIPVPAGDPQALAGAVRGLFDDSGKAAALGRAARLRAEAHHSPERVFGAWTELFERVTRTWTSGVGVP